jgi:hypothetical protein
MLFAQQDIASILGVSRVAIWKMGNEGRGPRVQYLNQRACVCTFSFLLDFLSRELAKTKRSKWLKRLAGGPQGAVA